MDLWYKKALQFENWEANLAEILKRINPENTEESLYGWSHVLLVWIQLLRYTQITTYLLLLSNPIQ